MGLDLSSALIADKFYYRVPRSQNISCCNVHLFISQKQKKKSIAFNSPQVVLLTAIKGNRGVSLSNSIEYVIPQIINYLEHKNPCFTFNNCIFIEHHNADSYHNSQYESERFHLVRIDDMMPKWESITAESIERMIQSNYNTEDMDILNSFVSRRWNILEPEVNWESISRKLNVMMEAYLS